MKIHCALLCGLIAAMPAFAQNGNGNGNGGADLIRELWFIDDATPVPTGQVDLRLTFRWITSSFPANLGDSSDDYVVTPSLTWGACENVEVFADVPVWVGDGGDAGALEEGNADTNLGFTWRLTDQQDYWPAAALRGTMRVPTGDNSNGVDGELRLLLTNEYDEGLRSHLNAFASTVNTDNDENLRHFQWGVAVGMDGPLTSDGAVRWVADYLHRSSFHYGIRNINQFEAGFEWNMDEAQKLGMSIQVGLDQSGDNSNLGAAVTYAYSLVR